MSAITLPSNTIVNTGIATFNAPNVHRLGSYSFAHQASALHEIDTEVRIYCLDETKSNEIGSITQFDNLASLKADDKITIFRCYGPTSDRFNVSVQHGKYKNSEIGKYAQYDHTLKFFFTRKRAKRSQYDHFPKQSVVIAKGWLKLQDLVSDDLILSQAHSAGTKSDLFTVDKGVYASVSSFVFSMLPEETKLYHQ